jgi:hypothetical protein
MLLDIVGRASSTRASMRRDKFSHRQENTLVTFILRKHSLKIQFTP